MAGELEGLRLQMRSLVDGLTHIDAAILVFRPDLHLEDLPEGVAPLPFAGFRGEIQRFLLDELRKANAPLSTFEIAERVMVKRGLDPTDRVLFKLIARRTGYSLARMRSRNKVTSKRAHRSAVMEWELTPPALGTVLLTSR
ncbi:MAG TPA: hypothetical protein VKC17_06730 [Sphingomicrobium sp.]|nr:hypothetical protein [Sphingomicrobium sp.]